jgi:hypothetical protein
MIEASKPRWEKILIDLASESENRSHIHKQNAQASGREFLCCPKLAPISVHQLQQRRRTVYSQQPALLIYGEAGNADKLMLSKATVGYYANSAGKYCGQEERDGTAASPNITRR